MNDNNEVVKFERVRGYWTTLHIRTPMTWPANKMICEYQGRRILILPAGEDTLPALAVVDEGEQEGSDDTDRFLLNFVSALVWSEKYPIEIVGMSGAGRGPFRWGKMVDQGMTIAERIHIPELPDPSDRNARTALALYREGMGSKSIAYSFLSYYKIINLRFGTPREQMDWINNSIGRLHTDVAKARLAKLQEIEPDIGSYLYVSGRTAVAHAYQEPIIDPDNPADERRLRDYLPLIRELAELLIEEEYGIRSR